MKTATTLICNDKGLHARASAKLVECVSDYSSKITVCRDGETVNADSIMGLLMLGAAKGTDIHISAEGTDEEEVLNAVIALVKNKFGEDS